MRRTRSILLGVLATVIATGAVAFMAAPAAAIEHRSNHCVGFDGTDLNELYDTNDAFVSPPFCDTAFAGSWWRPLAHWFAATSYHVAPPGYVPIGATPVQDFLAKLQSTRYVIDAGTSRERSIEVEASNLLIDTVTLDESTDMARFAPRLPSLPLGEHTVDMYLTMSAEHWDGFGLEEANRLPAGESFIQSAAVDVTEPQPDPQGPPHPTTPTLRVELVWDTDADLDLHLLHPNGDWSTSPWDCYWANRHPNWGRQTSRIDDPLLAVDDIDGYGPEIITLAQLERVTYQVGVLHFSGATGVPTAATVRVWADDELVAEQTTELPGPRHFWTVAAISLQGNNITVSPIDVIERLV